MHKQIGWVFRQLRHARGETLEQVAAALDTDAGNLSRYERCLQSMDEEAVCRLAKYYGVRVSDAYRMAEVGSTAHKGEDSVTMRIISTAAELPDSKQHQLLEFAEFLAAK